MTNKATDQELRALVPLPPTCPFCSSSTTETEWVDALGLPEYQRCECLDCGEMWNECAREEVE